MLKTTKTALAAMMSADPSITEMQRKEAIAILDGKAAAKTAEQPLDRALTRAQVADMMGVSKCTVTGYARRGIIRALKFGEGGQRTSRYSEASVREAMARQNEGGAA